MSYDTDTDWFIYSRYMPPPPPAAGAPPANLSREANGNQSDQNRQHTTTYWAPNLGNVLLVDGVDDVAGGFPLNLTPWVRENITDAWIRRNCKVFRGGRIRRVTVI